jgi:hypothetical protein
MLAEYPDQAVRKAATTRQFLPTGPVHMSSWVVNGNKAALVVEEMGFPSQSRYHVMYTDLDSGKNIFDFETDANGSPDLTTIPPIVSDKNILVCLGNQRIVNLRKSDGTVEWEYNLDQRVKGPMVLDKGRIAVQTESDSILVFGIRALQAIPAVFMMYQNSPNPFKNQTVLCYALPLRANVVIRIFDAKGRIVAILENSKKDAGYFSIVWKCDFDHSQKLSSGVYFAKINAGPFRKAIRMTMVK